jgi:hypothetical protein
MSSLLDMLVSNGYLFYYACIVIDKQLLKFGTMYSCNVQYTVELVVVTCFS